MINDVTVNNGRSDFNGSSMTGHEMAMVEARTRVNEILGRKVSGIPRSSANSKWSVEEDEYLKRNVKDVSLLGDDTGFVRLLHINGGYDRTSAAIYKRAERLFGSTPFVKMLELGWRKTCASERAAKVQEKPSREMHQAESDSSEYEEYCVALKRRPTLRQFLKMKDKVCSKCGVRGGSISANGKRGFYINANGNIYAACTSCYCQGTEERRKDSKSAPPETKQAVGSWDQLVRAAAERGEISVREALEALNRGRSA